MANKESRIKIKPVRLDVDLPELSQMKLRKEDAQEVEASMGIDTNLGLIQSIQTSRWCKKVLLDDEIIGVVGLAEAPGGRIGIPWSLSTEKVEKYPVEIIRKCRGLLAKMQEEFPILMNMVGSDNDCAIRLLRLVGFHVTDWTKTMYESGYQFRVFYWMRDKDKYKEVE